MDRVCVGDYTFIEKGSPCDDLPIVMVHGLAGNPDNWVEVLNRLPQGIRAIVPDIPFFKEGSRLDSVQACVEYTKGFIDAVVPNGAVLCGNSLGGHIVIDLATTWPEVSKGLVLTGSSGLFEKDMTTSHGVHPSRDKIDGMVREVFFDPIHATQDMVDEAYSLVCDRKSLKRLVKLAISAKRDNVLDRLKTLRCPALLIWGCDDIITPPDVAEAFHASIAGSELVWLRDCGHAPMMEHPEDFADSLVEWARKRTAVIDNDLIQTAG